VIQKAILVTKNFFCCLIWKMSEDNMAESRRRGDARANISDERVGKWRGVGGAVATDAREMSGEKQRGIINDDLKNVEFETSEDVEIQPS